MFMGRNAMKMDGALKSRGFFMKKFQQKFSVLNQNEILRESKAKEIQFDVG